MAVLRYLLALAIAVTGPIATNAISSPVFQSHGKATKEELAARAIAKAKYPRSNTRVTADAGYWYASFDIGDSKGLSLILDTGSDYVSVNPRLYKPSPASVDVGEEGVYTYSSMEENGCGSAAVSYHAYRDTMTYEGLTVKGQSLGASKEMPESPGNYTKFEHDGLIGLTLSPASSLANTKSTYLNSLCHQKLIEPCRLGLAFGFDKTGTMALGPAEESLFEGPLSTMSAGPNWATTGKLVIHGTEVIAHGKEIYYDSGTRNVKPAPPSFFPLPHYTRPPSFLLKLTSNPLPQSRSSSKPPSPAPSSNPSKSRLSSNTKPAVAASSTAITLATNLLKWVFKSAIRHLILMLRNSLSRIMGIIIVLLLLRA